jgi:hypothetical protein
LLKPKTNHVIPLLYTEEWHPVTFNVKTAFHSTDNNLQGSKLSDSPTSFLKSPVAIGHLAHSAPPMLSSCLLPLRHARSSPDLGPQHLLPFYLECSFTQAVAGPFLSLPSGL